MIKLQKPGVVIAVNKQDANFYKRAGFVEIKKDEKVPEEPKTLSEMTLAELKAEAKALGVKGYSGLGKEDLLNILTDEREKEEGE